MAWVDPSLGMGFVRERRRCRAVEMVAELCAKVDLVVGCGRWCGGVVLKSCWKM